MVAEYQAQTWLSKLVKTYQRAMGELTGKLKIGPGLGTSATRLMCKKDSRHLRCTLECMKSYWFFLAASLVSSSCRCPSGLGLLSM